VTTSRAVSALCLSGLVLIDDLVSRPTGVQSVSASCGATIIAVRTYLTGCAAMSTRPMWITFFPVTTIESPT
jgi:hypothetical protein